MTKFFDEMARVRRYLRDPQGNIWSDDVIIALWNETQRHLSMMRGLLEDVRVLGAPPRYHASYMFDWEYAYTGELDPVHKMYRDQGGFYVTTSRFEHQVHQGITSDAPDVEEMVSHPWEAWHASPGGLVEWPLPTDFFQAKGVYYDEWPIDYTPLRRILDNDPSWKTREGTPQAYTRVDVASNTITLYPRPDTVADDDLIHTGENAEFGLVADIEDDTFLSELGVITARTETFLSQEEGVAVSVLDVTDNLLLIYDVMPLDVETPGDDLQWPDWMLKYIRYGVLGRAYKANTDGRIPSLAGYWDRRYDLGLRALQRFASVSKEDRDYQLRTQGVSARVIRRHPRLPDTYPHVDP